MMNMFELPAMSKQVSFNSAYDHSSIIGYFRSVPELASVQKSLKI